LQNFRQGIPIILLWLTTIVIFVSSCGGNNFHSDNAMPSLIPNLPSPVTVTALNNTSLTTGILSNTYIAYVVGRNYQRIWIMNPDGSYQKPLTKQAGHYQYVTWSKDGSKIRFCSDIDGEYKSYIIYTDRTDEIEDSTWSPNQSPDGTKMVTALNDGSGVSGVNGLEIFVIDNFGRHKLTNNSFEDYSPVWSPDGDMIAFVSRRDGQTNVYLIGTDGSNERCITNNVFSAFGPSWSPDGKKIAFVASEAYWEERSNIRHIYVVNVDGSKQIKLTDHSASQPTWSPDGLKIAYVEEPVSAGESRQICVMNIDGTEKMLLTTDEGLEYSWLAWSPFFSTTR
jgi:Tol biopolymer transport system component